jgi:peptidoglycan/LPS O-acetylase OafA/YrhL
MRRYGYLDVIRGIAALAVVIQHGYEKYPWFYEKTETVFNFGRAAVVAFFLVSGFVMPFSLERSGSLKKFWVGRLLRLYPLYWLTLVAAIFIYASGMTPPPARFGVNAALANVTMLEGFLGFPDAIGSFWTLELELAFYVLLSGLFLMGMNRRSLLWAWVTVVSMALLGIALPLAFHRSTPLAPVEMIAAAMFGTVAYRLTTGEIGLRPALAVFGAGAGVLGPSLYIHYGLFHRSDVGSFSGCCALISTAAGYAFFFLLLAMRHLRYPPALLWLGRVSYSVYLLHPLVAAVLVWLVVPPAALVPLVIAATLGLSELTYRWVESPAMNYGKKLAARI